LTFQEWWDVTKTKIKYLTMQISKQLKKGQNKKDIEKFEKQLERAPLNVI
jgi:hypothetical protein